MQPPSCHLLVVPSSTSGSGLCSPVMVVLAIWIVCDSSTDELGTHQDDISRGGSASKYIFQNGSWTA